MLRLLRKSVATSAVAVVATLLLAGPSMALTTLTSADCGAVLGVGNYIDTEFELSANMNCPTTHGLIIGVSGITIDGKGYKLTGNLSTYDCKVGDVSCVGAGTPNDPYTPEHPQPCRDELPSGVYNAYASGVANSGCQGTTVGQGGCDDVVVKNLEITGFCDGIFMSGSCQAGAGTPPNAADWLQGCKVLGNYIHDNGKSDAQSCDATVGSGTTCGTHNLCANDGIFMTMTGVPMPSQGLQSALDYTCDSDEMADTVKVSGNLVTNQKGYARETGPAGNGINVLGGMESDTGDTYYSGCGQITNNQSYNNEVSGIMVTTATNLLIKANILKSNKYGGITIPCDFNPGNWIEGNYADSNYGPGIGVMCWQYIVNNTVFDSKEYNGPDLNFSTAGNGIYCEESGQAPHPNGTAAGPCIVVDNRAGGNADYDIDVNAASDIDCSAFTLYGPGNWVETMGANVPVACNVLKPDASYGNAWTPRQVDVNNDGVVDGKDTSYMGLKWGTTPIRHFRD